MMNAALFGLARKFPHGLLDTKVILEVIMGEYLHLLVKISGPTISLGVGNTTIMKNLHWLVQGT